MYCTYLGHRVVIYSIVEVVFRVEHSFISNSCLTLYFVIAESMRHWTTNFFQTIRLKKLAKCQKFQNAIRQIISMQKKIGSNLEELLLS